METLTVWIAHSDIEQVGTTITVHRTKEGAIDEAMDGYDPDDCDAGIAALRAEGHWALVDIAGDTTHEVFVYSQLIAP